VCFNYLRRPLVPLFASVLSPAGVLVLELATRANLKRHQRPRQQFLVSEGEVVELVSDLAIVQHDEGWYDNRHVAHVVARRPCDESTGSEDPSAGRRGYEPATPSPRDRVASSRRFQKPRM
jgi:hypothetical protein